MSPTRSSGERARFGGLWTFLAASLAAHAALIFLLPRSTLRPTTSHTPIELTVVQLPPPAPPKPPPALPKPVPAPRPVRVAIRHHAPRPRARVKPPPPKPLPRPPAVSPPTPPAKKPPPLLVGMTLDSTTTTGAFDAPVGNSAVGAMPKNAPDVRKVAPRPAPIPVAEVDSEPVLLGTLKVPYPPKARAAGIEGTVTLSIVVDTTGKVTSAEVVKGPGHGLNAAALKAVRKVRFRPARKDGQPVATLLRFAYTFELY